MDPKLLLVKSVTLLYRESQFTESLQNSADSIRPIIEAIELPEVSVGEMGSERDMLYALRQICFEMCSQPATHQYAQTELLQKIRHAVRDEDFLYNAFKEGIQHELSESELKKFVSNLRQELRNYDREKKAAELLWKTAKQVKFERSGITDIYGYYAQFVSQFEPYTTATKEKDPAITLSVDFSEPDQLSQILKKAQDVNSEEGILRLGWQALNDMFGGGLRRGETVLTAGLQHNFKTGFTLSIFKHIALYNKPYMLDPAKKPALVRITFEDPLTSNLAFLYRNIYENKTYQPADVLKQDTAAMGAYIRQEMEATGYKIFMYEVDPSQWTYLDFQNKILELEAEGYEIHLCMADYLGLLPTTGCLTNGPTGSDKRDLLRRMRNFFLSRRTTFVTPWQLSTEAKVLVRQGLEDTFVKEIANRGYYDSCRTLDQEVDLEVYFHIVKADGRSFLTIQRGKHRIINQTPERYKYCVLPFHDIGDVRDDLNGPNSALRKPGGMPLNSPEKNTFWSFDP